jgi:hypothetical protein
MPARFDSMQKSAFDRVTSLYAYNATWEPSAGGDIQTGMVLWADPTDIMELSDIPFTPELIFAEFFDTYFVGLKTAVDNSTNDETLTVDGVDYYVRYVRKKYDGHTHIAVLEKA